MTTSIAIFAYNGFGAAVNFSEEMHEPEQDVARAILWALTITVIAELLPVTAVLMGAQDLRAFFGAGNMFGEFIAGRGGSALNTGISLGVALAIFNGTIAVLLVAARVTFSTGRDRVWPQPISQALAFTHGRFHSPWVATLLCGVLAALACLVNLNLLLVLTGTGLILVYSSLCLAALIGRWGAGRGTALPDAMVPPGSNRGARRNVLCGLHKLVRSSHRTSELVCDPRGCNRLSLLLRAGSAPAGRLDAARAGGCVI